MSHHSVLDEILAEMDAISPEEYISSSSTSIKSTTTPAARPTSSSSRVSLLAAMKTKSAPSVNVSSSSRQSQESAFPARPTLAASTSSPRPVKLTTSSPPAKTPTVASAAVIRNLSDTSPGISSTPEISTTNQPPPAEGGASLSQGYDKIGHVSSPKSPPTFSPSLSTSSLPNPLRYLVMAAIITLVLGVGFFSYRELVRHSPQKSPSTPAFNTLAIAQELTSSSSQDEETALLRFQPGGDSVGSSSSRSSKARKSSSSATSVQTSSFLPPQFFFSHPSNLQPGTRPLTQKLVLKPGTFNFDSLSSPDLGTFTAQPGATNPSALSPIKAPTSAGEPKLVETQEGNLSPGKYQYQLTFLTYDGSTYRETEAGALSESITVDEEHRQVKLDSLPVYPTENVVARKIYRTSANGSSEESRLVATIADNFTTTFTDNIADTALADSPPATNSTGVFKYKVTYYNEAGETEGSSATTLSLDREGASVSLANIPLDPNNAAQGRRLYRTLAGGQTYYQVAQINNNANAYYTDSLSDAVLSNRDPLPEINTTGNNLYANVNKTIQLDSNGSVITDEKLIAQKRLDVNHAPHQRLKLATSLGKPNSQSEQKTGDLVYDASHHLLYLYNGHDFVAAIGAHPAVQNTTQTDTISSCLDNQCQIALSPAYPHLVLTSPTTNSIGNLNLISSAEDSSSTFYQWSSDQNTVQNYDLLLSFTIPGDFSAWQDQAITLNYTTDSHFTEDNSVEILVSSTEITSNSDSSNSAANFNSIMTSSSQTNQSVSGSNLLAIPASSLQTLNLQPGDQLSITLRPSSKNSHQVNLGQLTFNYLRSQNSTNSFSRQIAQLLTPSHLASQDLSFPRSLASINVQVPSQGNTGHDYLSLNTNGDLTVISHANQTTNSHSLDSLIEGNLILGGLQNSQAGECNTSFAGKIYYSLDDLQFHACRADDITEESFSWQTL